MCLGVVGCRLSCVVLHNKRPYFNKNFISNISYLLYSFYFPSFPLPCCVLYLVPSLTFSHPLLCICPIPYFIPSLTLSCPLPCPIPYFILSITLSCTSLTQSCKLPCPVLYPLKSPTLMKFVL